MSDVPSDVLCEILGRVPAECLFRFRTVCKAWRRIIDDPSFIKSHTNNQLSSTTLLIRNSTGSLYSLSLDALIYADGQQKIDVNHVKTLIRRGVPRLPALPVVSCNGLILISHYNINKIWVIWNPLTRECHELPKLDTDLCLMGRGLGYDYAADDYKVVRIDKKYHHGKFVHKTFVYSLKLDCWRMIKSCPCDSPRRSHGVFLNGALHWISWDMIIALDLGTEDYSQLPLPPVSTRAGEPFEMHLDALGGCLVLSYYYTIEGLDGWVMKDYGREKSWIKLFSIGELDIICAMGGLRPIAYLKSKGQVLLQHDSKFLWLDIEKNYAKKVTIHGLPNFLSSQICPGSLFRLNHSGGVGGSVVVRRTAGVKRKRKRKKANS
ncbi:hypothetical protein Pfo_000643, partial [Paulownia fortunei]